MFVVEMWGVPKKPCDGKDNRGFDCGDALWQSMLQLGKMYGWKPAGTLPYDQDALTLAAAQGFYEYDYEPVCYSYIEMVLAKDAANWAEALEKALADANFSKVLGELRQKTGRCL